MGLWFAMICQALPRNAKFPFFFDEPLVWLDSQRTGLQGVGRSREAAAK